MRRYLVPPLAQVEPDGSLGVDGEPLVRVDSHTEQARVGLNVKCPDFMKFFLMSYVDQFCLVPRPQIVEDRGLVEISEVRHVLTLLKLGRVHLSW